ncbi:MAG TPA: DMT family transporter [Candidatus Ozemobacteraceae bacterium]|nr:DMT family transporter [Candidatus Ozemobacteraceae bacterium]
MEREDEYDDSAIHQELSTSHHDPLIRILHHAIRVCIKLLAVLMVFVIFLGVLVWAGYTILLKRSLQTHTALEATGYSLILGAVLFLPIGVPAMASQDFHRISLAAWGSVAYLSLLTSVLAYFVWSWALSHVEAGRIAIVSNLQPVVATALAWYFLQEPITAQFLVGTSLTITGVILTQLHPLASSIPTAEAHHQT